MSSWKLRWELDKIANGEDRNYEDVWLWYRNNIHELAYRFDIHCTNLFMVSLGWVLPDSNVLYCIHDASLLETIRVAEILWHLALVFRPGRIEGSIPKACMQMLLLNQKLWLDEKGPTLYITQSPSEVPEEFDNQVWCFIGDSRPSHLTYASRIRYQGPVPLCLQILFLSQTQECGGLFMTLWTDDSSAMREKCEAWNKVGVFEKQDSPMGCRSLFGIQMRFRKALRYVLYKKVTPPILPLTSTTPACSNVYWIAISSLYVGKKHGLYINPFTSDTNTELSFPVAYLTSPTYNPTSPTYNPTYNPTSPSPPTYEPVSMSFAQNQNYSLNSRATRKKISIPCVFTKQKFGKECKRKCRYSRRSYYKYGKQANRYLYGENYANQSTSSVQGLKNSDEFENIVLKI